MKWSGYNETMRTLSFAIPPTWRDIPAILRGTYTPEVVELPRETDASWLECPPEFLLGCDYLADVDPKFAKFEAEPKVDKKIINHITYNVYDKPKKKKRTPYRLVEAEGTHPALDALKNEQDESVKQVRVGNFVGCKEDPDSYDLLPSNKSNNPLQGEN